MEIFKLPKLPYEMDALNPHISGETLKYHYGKHHKTYVETLNKLVEGKPEAKKSLETLIKESSGPIFNNAAQHWNHSFYWKCLSPAGGGKPKDDLAKAIRKNFGSDSEFIYRFTDAGKKLFGSGWVWAVKKPDESIDIVQTKDADNPIRFGLTPILVCDVWEHAYYVDYRNDRAKYMEAFWNVVNWSFMEFNLWKTKEEATAQSKDRG